MGRRSTILTFLIIGMFGTTLPTEPEQPQRRIWVKRLAITGFCIAVGAGLIWRVPLSKMVLTILPEPSEVPVPPQNSSFIPHKVNLPQNMQKSKQAEPIRPPLQQLADITQVLKGGRPPLRSVTAQREKSQKTKDETLALVEQHRKSGEGEEFNALQQQLGASSLAVLHNLENA